MSFIKSLVDKLFPKHAFKIIFLGLDASGRTTFLYKLKLGEVVTTIPTIGFNVETLSYKNFEFIAWDVGGCDKIRPLWRHYFSGLNGLIFFIDSHDIERLPNAFNELLTFLKEDSLKNAPVAVFFNKQDLPSALSPVELRQATPMEILTNPNCKLEFGSVLLNQGLHECFDWIILMNRAPNNTLANPIQNTASENNENKLSEEETKAKEQETLFTEWLSRVDEPDDEFIDKLITYQLDSWDHYTHLRIAFIYLTRYGRREGMKLIFDGIKKFIMNSTRTKRARGTTFHETMTYFWVHMVHYAMTVTKNNSGTFKEFLLMNPQFVNGGMFLHYYSKKLMLGTAESRTSVVLPDIRPLPSLITNINNKTNNSLSQFNQTIRLKNASDDQFIENFERKTLTNWSHENLLRVIFLYLKLETNENATSVILTQFENFLGENYNCTIINFWIEMIKYVISIETSNSNEEKNSSDNPLSQYTFETFSSTNNFQLLLNSTLYLQYYSEDLIDSNEAKTSFVTPNIKPLPFFTNNSKCVIS